MHIHLIGGFLGSGKTTAIAHAARLLTDKGLTVAVITNDQGNQLVDSRFVQQNALAGAEVTGGCFCCNYEDLDDEINRLQNEIKPAVVFAESVGACTDLVATVLKPLLQYRKDKVTYSGFVDAALLLDYLQGKTLPFLPETNYIWQKQLEEAEVLVINKTDLLSQNELDLLREKTKENYPSKQLLFQNSLDDASVTKWLQETEHASPVVHHSIDIDYPTYAAGEANLAWLDVEIEFFTGNDTASEKADRFIRGFAAAIRQKNYPIGHLKFFVMTDGKTQKISFTTTERLDALFAIQKSKAVQLLINARIQTEPDNLQAEMNHVLDEIKSGGDVIINQKNLMCFKPGYPEPTYRMA